MLNRKLHTWYVISLAALTFTAIAGCGSRGGGLPSTVTIELPDGTETQATLGAGVLSLANTKWQFFHASGSAQGPAFVTIAFGPAGNLQAFEDNTFASEYFGSTILFDAERHSTSQAGLTYFAATYGAETSDASGLAFEGLLNAFTAGIKVASARATASGTFDPDDPDTMTGEFAFVVDILVSSPGVPSDTQEQAFSFIAHRVVEE